MPVDPRTWSQLDPVTASRLNGDLASYHGLQFAPTGVRFHARRPLYKSTQVTTASLPVQPGGWRTPFQGYGSSVLVDTGADYGELLDATFSGTIQDNVAGSAGEPLAIPLPAANGGWYLTSTFVPMQCAASVPYAAAIANGFSGANPNITGMGTRQAGNSTHDTTPYAVDLTLFGTQGFFPVAFNGNSVSSTIRTTVDGSGEAVYWQAHWASIDPDHAYLAAQPAPKTSWLSTDTVTAALLNGPNGIRDVLRFLNCPPALRVNTNYSTSCANNTDTLVQMGTTALDSYNGWSGFTASTYTVPRSGLYLGYGLVSFKPGGTQGRAGINVNGTTYWGPASPAPSTGDQCVSKIQVFDLLAGDTVQLRAMQGSGGTLGTATDLLPRLVLLWLGNKGVPAALASVPDLSYRYAAGTPAVSMLATLNNHLANDLNFLTSKPYLLAYQGTAQAIPDSTDTALTMDTVSGMIHNSNGDNYSGWSSANHNYVAPRDGWYMAVMENFFPPATLTASPATFAEFQHSQHSGAQSAWDWYQHQNATTGNMPCGAAALGYYYLRAGDTLTPGCQAQLMSSGSTDTSVVAGAQSHCEIVWVSE